ncbi:fanconi-associated nuclease 1-like [Leptidea sinapis]|uniref:fanconi-associated nuclease 1-like n=1 Tax=Leptidea sinapis TaxID=189913 RepID=UPI0021C2EDBB|nr:fanconi-associated nuclease 1-like [Leptidea sinapis]
MLTHYCSKAEIVAVLVLKIYPALCAKEPPTSICYVHIEATTESQLGFDELLSMLKLEELKLICKDLKMKVTTKDDAIRSLMNFKNRKSNISSYFKGCKSDNEARLSKILRDKVGPSYKLSDLVQSTLSELYMLMYLGINQNIIREKKLELTLLYDKINRETYPIDKHMDIDDASVVFKTRHEFHRYLTANEMYVTFLNSTDTTEKISIVNDAYSNYNKINKEVMKSYKSLPEWLRRFTPPYIYIKIMEAGIAELKKVKIHIQLALDILTMMISQDSFRLHKKAEWYAEKALIYDKCMSDPDTAAQVLLEGFQNPDLPKASMDCMRPRAIKLADRQTNSLADEETRDRLRTYGHHDDILEKCVRSKHIYKQPMETYGRGKIKFQTKTVDGLSVLEAEEFCLTQYLDEGKYTHGEHWEGRILTTLFFLLFWDIIYAELRGVRGIFLTYYQNYPLDLFCDSFYTNRKCLIDDRLKEIEQAREDEIIAMMKRVWDSRPEYEMSGISRNVGWENVSDVAVCLGGRGVSAVCKRLATDYRYTHSGVPDLTLWNPRTRQIMFVEVKTDSDKPSIKQLQWMHYMKQNDIQVEFCYVGVNTSRSKARQGETRASS